MMFIQKVCYMKKKKNQTDQYFRLAVLPLEEVMSVLKDYSVNKEKYLSGRYSFNGNPSVNLSSLRLRTFTEKGTMCCTCGLEATHFAIERPKTSTKDRDYHINLWATDWKGDEILMTHDHRLARSLGGSDTIENTFPMCFNCNGTKAVFENEEYKQRIRQQKAKQLEENIHVSERTVCTEVVCVPSGAEG